MGGRLRPGWATATTTVSVELLADLDRIAAQGGFASRSRLIATVLADYVRSQRVEITAKDSRAEEPPRGSTTGAREP